MLSGLRFVLPLITLLSLSCWSTLADADLCVSSGGSNGVIHYQEVTGSFIGFCAASNSGGLLLPEGLIFGPDGNLYVSSAGTSSILRYDGKTGAFINAFVPSGSGGLSFPFGVTFGPDGNLYVSDNSSNNSILRYDGKTGAFINAFVPSDPTRNGGLSFPTFLTFTPTSIQFTTFSAKVDISVASSSFDVNSTLGSGGSINPLTQDVTVQLGGFTTIYPWV